MAMTQIRVELPDGSIKELPAGSTPLDVARSISEGLARQSVAARVDGQLVDLSHRLEADARLELVTSASRDGLEILRHSAAHLMAHAVKSLFSQDVQVTIGPAIENGFYYDFYSEKHTFTPEEFDVIEAKMTELATANLPIVREEMSRDSAIQLFRDMGETYKVQLIESLPNETVSLYRQGDFVDLCRGPHLPSTGHLKAFKLTSVAGAYWRGDEKDAMLQRIYATAFADRKELKSYLLKLEEAKARPSQAGKGARPFLLQRGSRRRPRHLAPQGGAAAYSSGGFRAPRAPQAWLRYRHGAADSAYRPLEDFGALR
jgi:threonyl-tRNA synthetase